MLESIRSPVEPSLHALPTFPLQNLLRFTGCLASLCGLALTESALLLAAAHVVTAVEPRLEAGGRPAPACGADRTPKGQDSHLRSRSPALPTSTSGSSRVLGHVAAHFQVNGPGKALLRFCNDAGSDWQVPVLVFLQPGRRRL